MYIPLPLVLPLVFARIFNMCLSGFWAVFVQEIKELVTKAWMEISGSKVASWAALFILRIPEVTNPVIKANMLV